MAIGPRVSDHFDAVLVHVDTSRKIDVIKCIREVNGLGLAEARHLIENLPQPVKKDISQEEGDALRERFYALGAHLQLRSASLT